MSLALIICGLSAAEILNSNSSLIRIRLGDNAFGGTNEVVYNAGIPTSMGGLAGVTAAPQAVSTNSIQGSSGAFTVRIVTDLNARSGLSALQGTFSYDTSQPLVCATPADCGTTSIAFSNISWATRDGDTHAAVTQFDNTANQQAQIQRDTNPANGGTNNRHRNYFRYQYDNAVLLPAGSYVGTMTINGEGQF